MADATLDDVCHLLQTMVEKLDLIAERIAASNQLVVGSREACRILDIGWVQLDKLVEDGLVKRVPHMRGRGGGYCYAVAELARVASAGVLDSDQAAAA